MPDCFNLKSNPLCHTLSNALLILTHNQSGFTKGDSAVNQLVNISNEFGKALDSEKDMRVVFWH
jgi:hypothetical protein